MLGLVATLVVGLLPRLLSCQSAPCDGQPPLIIYVFAGLIGLAMTGLAVALIGKFEPSLKRRLLWLVFGYNALIAVVKLVLAPLGLYTLNSTTDFTVQFLDQNTAPYYWLAGLVVFVIYALVWHAIYRQHLRRAKASIGLANPAATSTTAATAPTKRARHPLVLVFIVAGLGLLAYLTGFWILLYFFGAGAIDYLFLAATSPLALPIAIAITAAIILASGAFKEAEATAVEVKDATVLASLFWLGLTLIAMYHIMWIVFMITLVTTWPFNTYTPK